MVRQVVLLALISVALTPGLTSAHAASRHSEFIDYPAFLRAGARIEMIHDKGLIVEVIVRCKNSVGILTASKAEGLVCGPRHRCASNFATAIRRLCSNPGR